MGRPVDTGSHNTTVYIGYRFKGGINVGYDLDKMPWPRGRGRKCKYIFFSFTLFHNENDKSRIVNSNINFGLTYSI